MNSTNKKVQGAVNQGLLKNATSEQSIKRRIASPTIPPPAKPVIVPPRLMMAAQLKKSPVAPPVYRPQQVPRVLQTKSASAQLPHTRRAPRHPIAPPVYEPKTEKLVQPKMMSQVRTAPTAPPVYRPEQRTEQRTEQRKIAPSQMAPAAQAHTLPKAVQAYPKQVVTPGTLPVQIKAQPTAPPVYCPQPIPKVLQTKQLVSQQVSQWQHEHKTAQQRSASVRISAPISAESGNYRLTAGVGGRQVVSDLVYARGVVRPASADRPTVKLGGQPKSVQMMQGNQGPKPYSISGTGNEYLSKFAVFEGNDVVKKVARRLKLAQDAISYTKGKLIFGAANIEKQIEDSRGWSPVLASEISTFAGDISGKLGDKVVTSENIKTSDGFIKANRSEEAKTLNTMASNAIVAKWVGAGVCDHFAAVAMFYLQKTAEEGDAVYSITVEVDPNLSHACVVIGDAGLNANTLVNSETAVVADAWPTNPFAVRCLDWKYKSSGIKINLALAGGLKTNHLKVVRGAFKEPYRYGNIGETSYRRIGDRSDDGTGYGNIKNEVRKLKSNAESAFSKGSGPEKTSEWSKHLWRDENSLKET